MEVNNLRKHSIFYYSSILLFILLLFAGLHFGRKFLIPASLATFFAMFLWPVSKFFERKGVSRAGAAGICISILLLFLIALSLFFTSQVANFSSQLPDLQNKLTKKQGQVEEFLQSKLGVNTQNLFPNSGSESGTDTGAKSKPSKSNSSSGIRSSSGTGSPPDSDSHTNSDSTSETNTGATSGSGSSVRSDSASSSNSDTGSSSNTGTGSSNGKESVSGKGSGSGTGFSLGSGSSSLPISSIVSNVMRALKSIVLITFKTVVGIIIILVYVFLMLLYRHIFLNFILKLSSNKEKATKISRSVAKVSYQYLGGRLIVIVILAIINSVGLTLIGIKQGIFFGVLAALLDLIPYIGIIIGAGLPLIVSLVTKSEMWPFFAVLGLFLFVQLLENYFLTPKIVGSKVRLNPLFTIMTVLVGGYVWGIAGMLLFIPFLGMLKVLFDHVEPLHPYGYLIGDPKNRTEKK